MLSGFITDRCNQKSLPDQNKKELHLSFSISIRMESILLIKLFHFSLGNRIFIQFFQVFFCLFVPISKGYTILIEFSTLQTYGSDNTFVFAIFIFYSHALCVLQFKKEQRWETNQFTCLDLLVVFSFQGILFNSAHKVSVC